MRARRSVTKSPWGNYSTERGLKRACKAFLRAVKECAEGAPPDPRLSIMPEKPIRVGKVLSVLLVAFMFVSGVRAEVLSAVPLTDAGVNLGTTQTGNADTTNTMDRGYTLVGPCLLRIVTTVGATPTVTVNIKGSMDGTNFYNVTYALVATPTTYTVAAITITSATTNHYILVPQAPWRYLKLTTAPTRTLR